MPYPFQVYIGIMAGNAPIRTVVLLAGLTLSGIIITQVYWVNKAIDSREKQFDYAVQMALRNVVESICEANQVDVTSVDPIERVSTNYYVVRINDIIDLTSLEYHLRAEFQKRNIEQDFEYGVYDCNSQRMVYGELISVNPDFAEEPIANPPVLVENDYYFSVFFPALTGGLMWEMNGWKVITGLTILVIIFFSYSLSVMLRQKRLSAIQRDFINNITHEFKTPISTLKVASTVLLEGIKKDKRLHKYAGIINSETNRLEKQVHLLLKSAILEESRKIELTTVNLSDLVYSLVNRLGLTVRGDKVIKLQIKENVLVYGDYELIETVFTNLVDNAIKYGGNEISIAVDENNKDAIMTVHDNGVGIPEKDRKKIFNKFYRVSSGDTHNIKGFGLGLFVVMEAVKRMSAYIEVTCVDGCTFTIKFQRHGER
jgi:two-component system phosphate regulon sensor histidine kinase PhoR